MTESHPDAMTTSAVPERPPRPAAVMRQSPRRGRRLDTLGWLTLVLGGACLGFATDGHEWPVGLLLVVIGLTLIAAGAMTVLRGRRHLATVLSSLHSLPPHEPIVLFLRTFSSDSGFARISGFRFRRLRAWRTATPADFRTEEEQVARAVSGFGRMVALGQPSDQLPRTGAERSYASDEEWQAEVLRALDRANLVLLAAGPGQSLAWEISQVVRRNLPTHLVILISREQNEYLEFRRTTAHLFPKELPELPKKRVRQLLLRGRYVQAAIWFDADWNPRLEMLDGRFPLTGLAQRTQRALPRALRQFYARAGVPSPRKRPKPPPRPTSATLSLVVFTMWACPFALIFVFFSVLSIFTSIIFDVNYFIGTPVTPTDPIIVVENDVTTTYRIFKWTPFYIPIPDQVDISPDYAISWLFFILAFMTTAITCIATWIVKWIFQAWRGNPRAIMRTHIFATAGTTTIAAASVFSFNNEMLFDVILLFAAVAAISLVFNLIPGFACILLTICTLGLFAPTILLMRNDVRKWLESCE